MVATTAVIAPGQGQLKHGTLSLPEMFGQSIANAAPTLTPALNISVCAGLAGVNTWAAYLIATIGLVFVGGSIATLARRHPEAGSYFVYIGRNFGPMTGALSGWSMILAYITTAAAVVFGFPLFLQNFLAVFHIALSFGQQAVIAVLFLGLVTFAAYRDIQMSSRLAVICETVSCGIIIIITGIVIGKHGAVVDPVQFQFSKGMGGTVSALVFAVFSFVGFESAATLGKESANPHRNVPIAVIGSAAVAGIFFTVIAYCMVLGMDNNAGSIGGSSSPFADMTNRAGLPWAAGVVYFAALISAFACALACINASSRMLYSMGRFQFLHGSMGLVHKVHKTPHIAVYASALITLVIVLGMLPLGLLDSFGLTGTIATYGFVIVYFGVAITAPVDMMRSGGLKPVHVICGAIGAVMMGFVIFSSVFPYPSGQFGALPPIFLAYMVLGAIWFAILKAKRPQVLLSIATDMEG